jgi:hypothetical protein
MKRIAFRILAVAMSLTAVFLVLIALAPLGLYALGLSNVDGRPLPPAASSHLTPVDQALLERAFRAPQPITVERLSPWTYITSILEDSNQTAAANGLNAASFVALHYNVCHLRNRRSTWWHLSGEDAVVGSLRSRASLRLLPRAPHFPGFRATRHPLPMPSWVLCIWVTRLTLGAVVAFRDSDVC